MLFSIYGIRVFYSQCSQQHVLAASQQHVLAAVAAFIRVLLLLQEYKGKNMVSCVAVTP